VALGLEIVRRAGELHRDPSIFGHFDNYVTAGTRYDFSNFGALLAATPINWSIAAATYGFLAGATTRIIAWLFQY
jgi:hypothetical protein